MTRPVVPVILSGGSGTRLWPLSRADRPKQFLPLVGDETLFQQTLLRLDALPGGVGEPIVVCNEAHRFLVAEQLREIGREARAIVLEPAGRNTAPAVAVAALVAQRSAGEEDPILLVLPADHVILDAERFRAAVVRAVAAAGAGHLVTFGIVPTRPETGYGYVKRGDEQGDWALVERFVEKPDLATARNYVKSGDYYWNSGMFVFGAATMLAELGRAAPAILAACERAVAAARIDEDFMRLGDGFLDSPSDSIDYAVMEKTDRAAVVPLDAGWSDVGSWDALHEVVDKDGAGNFTRGRVIAEGCSGSYIAAESRTVAVYGLGDVVVVETGDAVLVVPREASQAVKILAERAAEAGQAPGE